MKALAAPLRALLFLPVLFCLAGFKVPKYYQTKDRATPEKALDYYVIERNNERLTLNAEKTLPFVRGDSLLIVSAVLKDGSTVEGEVNVVGFRPPGDKGSRNDTGVLIDTSDNLDKKFWAVDDRERLMLLFLPVKKCSMVWLICNALSQG